MTFALRFRGRPVHQLNGALRLGRRHRGVDIIQYIIIAVPEKARHVLATARVAADCNGVRLTDGHGDSNHGELLVVDPPLTR